MTAIQHIYKPTDTHTGILYSWFGAMNTRVDVLLCGGSESDLKCIAEQICNRIKAIEKTGNRFDPDSELSFVNKTAFDHPVKISPDLFSVVADSLHYNKLTCGYFDVTVNTENHTEKSVSNILLEEHNSTISFSQQGLQINLSGFLKGYALDSVLHILDRFDISDALINVGNSSVMAKGNHPNGEGWKVGIDNKTDTPSPEGILLKNQCLTTSGNDTWGRKHIIDPYSNRYIEGLRQISVITENAAEGEALSTALFAAPKDKYNAILKGFNISAQAICR